MVGAKIDAPDKVEMNSLVLLSEESPSFLCAKIFFLG
jgi:hypothetical protein